MISALRTRPPFYLAMVTAVVLATLGGALWFQARYDGSPDQAVALTRFTNAEYPEDPEEQSLVFGNYPHRAVRIQRIGGSRYRFVFEPGSDHAAAIELPDVELAHLVAAVPAWVKSDLDLTKVGLIDREWNRQQVSFGRKSHHVRVHEGGDGFERKRLSRVDLARNCLNAGLWEVLLFTVEEGRERVYEHAWFTFPLGLYKDLFEQVNGLSYWDYWWSLEHWVNPAGTFIRLDRLRTAEKEWAVTAAPQWDEAPRWQGEQRLKRKNVLAPASLHIYRDWYTQSVRFASFIPPGRYSVAHPRETQLHYLSEFAGAALRRVRTPAHSNPLYEIELRFKDARTGDPTRLIFGGLDLQSLPILSADQYARGWQAPLGIGNPGFFESYEDVLANPPLQRPFYGFHLDADDHWIDHHAVGVDGPLLHRDAEDPSIIHLYLLSYERHALLNHIVVTVPPDARR